MRYAIYFTPPHDAPLTRAASRWLGRDAFTGETFPLPAAGLLSPAEHERHTVAPRRYGFHATLKAPFRLATGATEAALVAAMDAFASATRPVLLPATVARRIEGFFALTPAAHSRELDDLAARVVTAFEPFRAPLSEADVARRNPELLTAAQRDHLEHWGYPYVLDEFRFHMTLTGRVDGEAAGRIEAALDAHFGPLLSAPLDIDAIALFVEPEPGAPFTVRSVHALGGRELRRTA